MLSAVPHVELLLKERGGKGRQARRGKEDHDLRRWDRGTGGPGRDNDLLRAQPS